MDLQALVSAHQLRDIRELFDMSYGDESDPDEYFNFTEPEIGTILVMADGESVLVGDVNQAGGACDCCRKWRSHPRHFKGFIPPSEWMKG